MPLVDFNHIHFGENKVQEAENKWKSIKLKYPNLKLHMLGPLQTNKAKKALQLFDYIHSLDNEKLAKKLSANEKDSTKKVKIFIQVNIADEKQKSGIPIKDLSNFYHYCKENLSLNIIGLMCLPPFDLDSNEFFNTLKREARKLQLKSNPKYPAIRYEGMHEEVKKNVILIADCSSSPRIKGIFKSMNQKFKKD